MRKLLLSSVLSCIIGVTSANAQVIDSLADVGKYEFLGVRVGVSMNNALRTIVRENDTYYSFLADAVFGRYMFVAEYGWSEISRTNINESTNIVDNPYEYDNQGSFFRIGPDVNLLINKTKTSFRADGDIIYFGLRFARAQVTDELTFRTRDDVTDANGNDNAYWPSQTLTAGNNNRGVIWFEMTAGMKVQLYRNIFLGYSLRFKFARNFLGDPSLIPYEIPGYGFGENSEQFRFDYYIFYRFPFRK